MHNKLGVKGRGGGGGVVDVEVVGTVAVAVAKARVAGRVGRAAVAGGAEAGGAVCDGNPSRELT